MKIQFYGAAQRVTGSKHLITTQKGTKILLDCGLFQGINTSELNLQFGFDPKEIDILILSHAHIDHTGLVPRLVKKGFSGKIFSTHATKDLCNIMLYDSAYIQEKDLERVNERRKKRGEPLLELLYGEEDVKNALALFETVKYHESFELEPGVTAEYYDTGHILGSAGIYLTFEEETGIKTLFFTGDVGRPNDKILRSPEAFPQANYIICESTYGNRLHEPEIDMKAHLLQVVHDTCVVRQGKLIIPAFAVDRTQELVYALDQLASEGRLPKIPVYVDSPLSVKATMAMKDNEECFNPEILAYIKHDGDAFGFDNLHYISDVNQSKALNSRKGPCIIISASGMAEAGRVKHHIANNVENPNNTILLVGYCSPETLGAVLKAQPETVKIFGEVHKVNAKIEVMDSFSAHADYVELLAYLGCQKATDVKKLFLVHGELPNQLAFKNRLLLAGFNEILIPAQGEGFEL
ncbi:MBL fold metallo-hydrolase RNA specificity domain-containing protein [Emticicia soli]|uniref:MBL fold metallo-hydrolase RNA specificity domain-containing protein n=1 Tax=Emticicia soli TaxID=2027878 RepID=A0ABW5JC99_9BACT